MRERTIVSENGIALSGYGADTDIDRSRQAGFLAHLTKPVRIQALEAVLAKQGPGARVE